MKWKIEDPQLCLNLIAAIILLIGLSSAALIYATARSESIGVLGYENEGGTEYPIMPDDSKQYLRGLELYGGTANVLADEFRRWFDGLWHGKSLAFTVALITIVLAAGVRYAANHLPSTLKSDARSENNEGQSG
jgi:hypothetical protein